MPKQYHIKRYPHIFYTLKKRHKKYGYRYTYYDPKHKRHEVTRRNFSSVQKAQIQLDRMKIALHIHNGMKNHNPTIKEWIRNFIQSNRYHWKPSTYQTYVTIFHDFILPYLGNVRVTNLNKSLYQRLCINALIRKKLKHNTIVDVHHRMITLMNAAVDNGIVPRNKIKGTKIPTSTGKIKKRIMSREELQKFNEQLDREPFLYQVIFRTLQDTGMREGELLGLKWHDIDLAHLRITIAHTRDSNGYRSPKTSSSRRTIGISQHLARLLVKYYNYQYQNFQKEHHTLDNNTFVITDCYDRPLSNTSISRNLSRILKAAGLGYLSGHFTAHTFRHMFASYLLNHGLPLTDVSHALGHANPQTTLSIYTERNPNDTKNLGKRIENIYKQPNSQRKDHHK